MLLTKGRLRTLKPEELAKQSELNKLSPEQLALLDKSFNLPSANRFEGGSYSAPPVSRTAPIAPPSPKYPNPIGVSDNGMYRQSPNIPAPQTVGGYGMRQQYADSLANPRINQGYLTPPRDAQSSLPPVPKPPLAAYNPPNPRSPLSTRIGAGLDRATTGLTRVSAAITVGTSIATAIQRRDTASTIGAAVDVASTVLAVIPHPYAQGAALVLQLGKAIFNGFFNSPNNAPQQGQPANFSGGQKSGDPNLGYWIGFDYFNPEQNQTYTLSNPVPYNTQGLQQLAGGKSISSVQFYQSGVRTNYRLIYGDGTIRESDLGYGISQSPVLCTLLKVHLVLYNYLNDTVIPDNFGDPAPIVPDVQAPNNDGFQVPDLSDITDRLGALQDGIDSLQGLRGLIKASQANNGVTPYVPNFTPRPLRAPQSTVDAKPSPSPNYRTTPAPNININNQASASASPKTSLNPKIETNPVGKPAPAPTKTPQKQKEEDDRFKQCCEPSFSSIKVKKFDKCEDGAPKFVEISISVPKGTETATAKLFESVANTEGLQCSMGATSVTFPDSWAGKVPDDRPQAVVYYREWNGSKFGLYKHSVSIPHYSKPKGFKPTLPIIKKGSSFGILKFKDNSQIIVNCESITEAKRVINALKQFSGIQAKGARAKFGEYGDGDLKRVTTKAVRLDFYSKGRANALPDWSVDL